MTAIEAATNQSENWEVHARVVFEELNEKQRRWRRSAAWGNQRERVHSDAKFSDVECSGGTKTVIVEKAVRRGGVFAGATDVMRAVAMPPATQHAADIVL